MLNSEITSLKMSLSNDGDNSGQLPFLPHLVLHEICPFLNLSELKVFRQVCKQWYFVSSTYIKNLGCIKLNTKLQNFSQFANSKKDADILYPRNLKLLINPLTFGCECEECNKNKNNGRDGINFRQFDQSSLETIFGKCSSGIRSLNLAYADRKTPFFNRNVTHDLKIDWEKILLREEFEILRQLRINNDVSFQLTHDSGINNVFKKLTHLSLSHSSGKNAFATTILKMCSSLRSLTIECDKPGTMVIGTDLPVIILDAFKDAKKENEFLVFEELKLYGLSLFPRLPFTKHTQIFQKIQALNLKLKVLHVSMGIEYDPLHPHDANGQQENVNLMPEIQAVLESQKDNLVSLALPQFWSKSQTEVPHFPQMNHLKELQISVNFRLPMTELHHKLPVLKSLTLYFLEYIPMLWPMIFKYVSYNQVKGLSELANQLRQNIPPCVTVTELVLESVTNADILIGLSKVFPNVQFLKVDLQSEHLQTLWRSWPRLQELTLMVQHFDTDAHILVQAFHPHAGKQRDSPKFHSGVIGISAEDCEALIESSVSFMSLKMENYDFNLPSIRDLKELKKLNLKSEMTCNVALMLGILPMKNLIEVEITDCDITIDCVPHILSCNPNIKRWKFKGVCYMDFYTDIPRYNLELVNWTISSNHEVKLQPKYKYKPFRTGNPLTRLSQDDDKISLPNVQDYGRGKCLQWTPYHVRPPPPDDVC